MVSKLKTTSVFKAVLRLFLLGSIIGPGAGILAATPHASGKDIEDRDYARRAVDVLMDGDPETAITIFRQIEQSDPQSPLGYLLEAEAIWWKIYYSTAKLLDPDVFDVSVQETSAYDSHFSDLIKVAITRAEVRIRAESDVARNTLYEGMAYALDARLSGLRGKDLASARAGKKMRTLLLAALKLDPDLTDANLGLGSYNYFIDSLPPAIKVLKILVNVAGGNRGLGLQQIREASEKGDLVKSEAKFYLAKTYSGDREKQYQKSLELFQDLARQYPHNPLWTLLSANLQAQLGKTHEAEELYRHVYAQTKNINTEPQHAVHLAARDVLRRQHADKTFSD